MVNNDINAIFQYSIVLGHFTAVTQSKGREDTTVEVLRLLLLSMAPHRLPLAGGSFLYLRFQLFELLGRLQLPGLVGISGSSVVSSVLGYGGASVQRVGLPG